MQAMLWQPSQKGGKLARNDMFEEILSRKEMSKAFSAIVRGVPLKNEEALQRCTCTDEGHSGTAGHDRHGSPCMLVSTA